MLFPPVLWGSSASAVLGLVATHLVAAAVAVPALTRTLRRLDVGFGGE